MNLKNVCTGVSSTDEPTIRGRREKGGGDIKLSCHNLPRTDSVASVTSSRGGVQKGVKVPESRLFHVRRRVNCGFRKD